jgi:hypothetical protein
MAALFVSYRREDTSGHAGRLYDRLADRFGREQVFRDVDEISYGDDFVDTIDEAVGSCKALIAIIGPDWLNIQDRHGHRRLDDPNDFVRIELESALTRGIPIFPVLVRGAEMPDASELPEDLSRLARRQALEVSETRYEYDVGQLLAVLQKKAGIAPQQAHESRVTQAPNTAQPHTPTLVESAADGSDLTAPVATGKRHRSQVPNRKNGALRGASWGTLYAIVCIIAVFHDDQRLQHGQGDMILGFVVYTAIAAAVGAACGAIVGTSPGVLVPIAASITAVAAVWVAVWGTYQDVVITGLIMGGGVAAILVSIVWRLFQRRNAGSHPDHAR